MSRKIHHNTIWLTPTQASALTGCERHSFRRWAAEGVIRCKENPRSPRRARKDGNIQDAGWLYNRQDIEQNILGIN